MKHLKTVLSFATLYLSLAIGINAQTGISFYNLGNATFQNSFYNPAFIPEGKLFLGLPVLSGIHVHANNKFDYSDVIRRSENDKQIDFDGFVASLQNNNMVSATVDVSLFHLAYTTPSRINFSVFANERIQADVLYTKEFMKFGLESTISQLNEAVKIDKTAASASYFREIGAGFSGHIPELKMNVGVRLKYLQGIFNASTNRYTAEITTQGDTYAINLELQDATLRTSGIDILRGRTGDLASHLINNPNKGVAADFGMSMKLNQYMSFSASLVDLGFISWKEDVTNYTLPDTIMNYNGLDLREPDNLEQKIEDSLISRFRRRVIRTYDPYTAMLNPKLFTSLSYKTTAQGELVGSLGTRLIKGRLNYLFGAGYRHRFGNFLIASASLTRLPQQFINVGAGLAVKGGPVQLYLAADQLWNIDLTKAKSFDFRLGINFIFMGRDDKKKSPTAKPRSYEQPQATSNRFLGKKVKAKGQNGIYTIIKKQTRRKKKEYSKPNSNILSGKATYETTEVVSPPIPSEGKKTTIITSPPIPGSKKKVRAGSSDPIPSGNRKVKSKKSPPIPNGKKKTKND